jgi:OOP family OmpA-OmpF porin
MPRQPSFTPSPRRARCVQIERILGDATMNERTIVGGGVAAWLLLAIFCIVHHRPLSAVALPASPALQLAARYEPPRITLTGRVPDEAARAAVEMRARKIYGTANITNAIAVTDVAQPAEFADAAAAFPPDLRGAAAGARATLADGVLTLEGDVGSERIQADLVHGIAAAAPKLRLDNRLRIAPAQRIAASIAELLGRRTVEFDSGAATLTTAGRETLDLIAPLLAADPGARFEIAGHTDDRGEAAFNRDLSERRAAAVRDYLESKGVAAERFDVRGYGDTRPIADNASATGRQKNRRIEFRAR